MSAVSFEIDGTKHDLYFGMDAFEVIFGFMNSQAVQGTKPSPFTSASYIIYGGLINQAILDEKPKPKYGDVYKLCEKLYNLPEEVQAPIFSVYESSIAKEALTKRLDELSGKGEDKKKAVDKKSKK